MANVTVYGENSGENWTEASSGPQRSMGCHTISITELGRGYRRSQQKT